jgi:hypothetical protein
VAALSCLKCASHPGEFFWSPTSIFFAEKQKIEKRNKKYKTIMKESMFNKHVTEAQTEKVAS